MSWTDRDDNPRQFGNAWADKRLWRLVFGSVSLGTWQGIRIRVHASLIYLVAINLALCQLKGGMGWRNALVSGIILFGTVLLHELGHCLAARAVGGTADDILLWPLGGLTTSQTAHRPLPRFIAVAGGPAVNVAICAVTLTALVALHNRFSFLHAPLNPVWYAGTVTGMSYYLGWVFLVSYILLMFNLLPIFPLDGGQMLQTMLWPRLGYVSSMNIACVTGMIGAVVMGLLGLWLNLTLTFLAVCGFLMCYSKRRILHELSASEGEGALEFADSLEPEPRPIRRKRSRRMLARSRRLAAREHAEHNRIDEILAKVSEHGMAGLTWWERRVLHKATAKRRKEEAEEMLNTER